METQFSVTETRVSATETQVSVMGIWVSATETRLPVMGIWVSGFEIRVFGMEIRVSNTENQHRGLTELSAANPLPFRPVTDTAQRIFSHLRERQGEMASLLRELALLESPSHDPASQEPIFARLAAELEAAGLRVRRLPGRKSGGQLWAVRRQRRRGAPAQLLLGHCDTVWPAGTLERMPVELRDGRLAGPGVYDMKGGLVQGIFALRALRDLGLEPPVEPAFFINSDEELGSGESLARIERLARRVRRVFVLEPSLGPDGK